jgi:hypothetical protein
LALAEESADVVIIDAVGADKATDVIENIRHDYATVNRIMT